MNAGGLTKRITIEKRVDARTASGQQMERYEPRCTVWAEMQCTDSKTVDDRGAVQHEGLYRFYIRWRGDILASDRVVYHGRIFTLTGPPADWKGQRIGLTLITKELV